MREWRLACVALAAIIIMGGPVTEAQRTSARLSRPHGLAFANGKLYFTAEADKKVAHYDPATDKIDGQLETGQATTHMVLPSKDLRAIVGRHRPGRHGVGYGTAMTLQISEFRFQITASRLRSGRS